MANDLVKAADLGLAALEPESESAALLQEALAGESLTMGDFERVKMPTGGATKFMRNVLGSDEVVDAIEGVIVHQGMSRSYWENPDPKEGEQPNCKSPDAVFGYGSPGDELRAQSPPQGCEVCPMSQFGSSKKPNSPNGQACRLTRDLFVLPKGGGLLPLMLSLPPGSLPSGKGYIVDLASHGIPYYGVATRIALVKATSKGGQAFAQAQFSMIGRLDDETVERVREYRKMIEPAVKKSVPAEAVVDSTATAE